MTCETKNFLVSLKLNQDSSKWKKKSGKTKEKTPQNFRGGGGGWECSQNLCYILRFQYNELVSTDTFLTLLGVHQSGKKVIDSDFKTRLKENQK